MAFPDVIIEFAAVSTRGEELSAQSGWTEITSFVESMSGNLRGRTYELDRSETGSVRFQLDNSDGRFTPSSPLSPYYPYVTAGRRLRVRGKNMARINIGLTGGQEGSAQGFFLAPSGVTRTDTGAAVVGAPVAVVHGAGAFAFPAQLATEDTHIEATLASGTPAGTYRVLTWWAPAERGVRLTHSAYLWRVAGTQPTATLALANRYFDADLTELADTTGTAAWTATVAPTLVAFSHVPPDDACYCMQSLIITTSGTASTDLTYAVAGIQTELPANLVPSISGVLNVEQWYLAGDTNTGTVDLNASTVRTTWAADSVELRTTIPHLVPGDTYTFAVRAIKSGGPDVLLTVDDGGDGVTLTGTSSADLSLTFVATAPEMEIRFIPASAATGSTLRLSRARCIAGEGPITVAAGDTDTDVTEWERPLPVFEGWVENWPVRLTAASSDITITVNGRGKKLGETKMASTLRQAFMQDSPALLMPLTDDPKDSQGKISISGTWADESNATQLTPSTSKTGPGLATFTFGALVGPTEEDAVRMVQASSALGYAVAVPWSTDYIAPTVRVPPKTVSKRYYATWSRSFDDLNNPRGDGSTHCYQGDAGDAYGNQRSLLGFNWQGMVADLANAQILGAWLTLYNRHWYLHAGGTAYIGTHIYTVKPGTFSTASTKARRITSANWARYTWRTINLGAGIGGEFQRQISRGIVIGWGSAGNTAHSGHFGGSADPEKPYLTIKYRK